jgi:hypothetical protein
MKKLLLSGLALSVLVIADVKSSNATEKQVEDLAAIVATLKQVAINDGKIADNFAKAKEALANIERELASNPSPQQRSELEADKRKVLAEVETNRRIAAENAQVLKGITEQQKKLFGDSCPKSQAGRDALSKTAEAAQVNVNNNNNLNQAAAAAAGAAVPAQPPARQSWAEWIMGKNKDCANKG